MKNIEKFFFRIVASDLIVALSPILKSSFRFLEKKFLKYLSLYLWT